MKKSHMDHAEENVDVIFLRLSIHARAGINPNCVTLERWHFLQLAHLVIQFVNL